MKKYKYDIEVTDTFSGEAIYSWVRRYQVEVPINSSPVRAAKKSAGMTGAARRTLETHL